MTLEALRSSDCYHLGLVLILLSVLSSSSIRTPLMPVPVDNWDELDLEVMFNRREPKVALSTLRILRETLDKIEANDGVWNNDVLMPGTEGL